MSLKISVTQEDIDLGRKRNCHFCPIARAVRRQFKGAHISVSPGMIKIEETYYALPVQAMAFIDAFDMSMSVVPIEFEVRRMQLEDY